MIDGHHTTTDWQTHSGKVCVMAVGTFEQHSHHLPLDTDNIEGDFFARMVAEGLDAALLPTLRFGTSLEQTGFRGTMTLRPETLMQIIRDIASELERQSFARLVIVNSHGGNFCLAPVVRDINRRNGPLKILLVNFWEYSDPEIAVEHRQHGREIHAGEWETSLMMALAPELVRAERADMPVREDEEHPLAQPDLTMFGVGHFAPDGAVGWPSYASAEKGEKIIESIRERMLPHIRDRLRRFDELPRYSGGGGIALRRMQPGDINAAMRLKDIAGWNQMPEDWALFLREHPDGCLVAVANGTVVGTLASINYEDCFAWIGMVLVDPDYRRIGIATRLLQGGLADLDNCPCIKLDATPAGQKVYERLGFEAEYRLGRFVAAVVPGVPAAEGAMPLRKEDLGEVDTLDRTAFGASRRGVLTDLLERAPESAWKVERDGRICAFCFGRPGSNSFQIGPVVAQDTDVARQVTCSAFAQLRGRPALIDVPADQNEFRAWLAELGFAEQRPFIRMFRGQNVPGQPAHMYAICGPELG